MSNFDDRRCVECTNAKFKETFGEGHKMYICGKHRTAITDLTLVSSIIGCKGKDFERRQS
jgi:hypothetical protein